MCTPMVNQSILNNDVNVYSSDIYIRTVGETISAREGSFDILKHFLFMMNWLFFVTVLASYHLCKFCFIVK